MKFYMTPGSCSTGIHIILEELEEVFEAHIVNLPAGDHFKPDYVAINPKSTIPALVRPDGTTLTEVVSIAYWLARSRGRGRLWPGETEAETRALETMVYVVSTLHGQGFARLFATPTFAASPGDRAKVEALGRDIIQQGFSILDRALEGRDYVAGPFSAADPILFYVEFWAEKTGIALPSNLAAHYRRMLERPVVRRVLREEGYNLALLGVEQSRPN
ncbi:glutathione S-transferase N-terminal domain-containing protein [Xanthobacter dioxanivorans]|uniref:Glutathione S-transferase N-terminal domain-containing protein n=1 Tax=Xanthobacter dioxanivorans TaxID=2528964 RepID=A0A974PU10_9HYPH|nr:glutathione S-transferase N-terminal domain-containing protein [Xanthobacter dioxanivorans]QRG09456.1 glutathione S-transferase N-terminal domain-containing protein [Xanthobacter dioxanivorans]